MASLGHNGDSFIIYTTEEGGMFHVAKGDRDDYERILETGQINVLAGFDDDGTPFVVADPVYVAYLTVVETNYDTILGSSREEEAS